MWFTLPAMDEVRIAKLFVYPVKGCRGIALSAAEVGERGFVHDRRGVLRLGDRCTVEPRP